MRASQLRGPNKRLHSRIDGFGGGKVKIVWVGRDQNKAADKLAGLARERSAVSTWGIGFYRCLNLTTMGLWSLYSSHSLDGISMTSSSRLATAFDAKR